MKLLKAAWTGFGAILLSAVLLLPVAAFGTITFERSFSLPSSGWAAPQRIIQTLDGGYLVAATVVAETLGGGEVRIALAKLDSLGSLEWTKVYNADEVWCSTADYSITPLAVSADSHYFVGGQCMDTLNGIADALLLKVKSSNGVILWKFHYSAPGWDWFSDVAPTPDGGCYACGKLTTVARSGLGVMRFSRDGVPLWWEIYDPIDSLSTTGGTILLMPDGDCVLSGLISVNEPDYHSLWLLTMRIDSTGQVLWQEIETAADRSHYRYETLSLTPTGNIAVCGFYSGHQHKPADSSGGFVKVFRPNGEKLLDTLVMVHRHSIPLPFMYFRGGKSTPDSGFVMVGEFFSESLLNNYPQRIALLKLNADAESVWFRTYGPKRIVGYGLDVISTRDGGFAILGQLASWAQGPIYIFKTDSLGMIYWSDVSEERRAPLREMALELFPNPFTNRTTIQYSLPDPCHITITALDATGRKVADLFDGDAAGGTLLWHPKDLPQGIYFIRLETPNSALTQRTLLLR